MSDGIFIRDERPKSKKAVKEAFATDPEGIEVEITSFHDPRCGEIVSLASLLHDLWPGKRIDFVGPCPFTNRKFYGSFKMGLDGKVKVI